jgi:hypothetical protein
MAKITGVGGVFFKSTGDNAALAAWYRKHLGLPLEDFGGAIFRWPDDKAEDRGLTVWHVAAKDSDTKTASLRGSWTQMTRRSISGSRQCGTTRTKVPESAA